MKFTKIAVTFFISMLIFCGCSKKSDVVLKINDTQITKAEFDSDYNKIKNAQLKFVPKQYQNDKSYVALSIKDKFTNDLIVRELLKQEFDRRKIEASQDEINAKKDAIIKQVGSVEKFNNLLKENDISEQKLNSDLAQDVRMEKLLEMLDYKKISDKDVENYYKQNKNQFVMPERVRVSHILVDTNYETIKRKITDDDKEAKLSTEEIDKMAKEQVKKNEDLIKSLKEQADKNPSKFASLAKENSIDTASAQNGGDLGYVAKSDVVKEFGDMAFSMKVGTISPIVKTQYGSHIIYLKDKSKGGVQTLAEIKPELKLYLEKKSKLDALQKLIEGLKENATIVYVDENLSPENIKKQIEQALPKQKENEQTQGAPKSKLKAIEKANQEK